MNQSGKSTIPAPPIGTRLTREQVEFITGGRPEQVWSLLAAMTKNKQEQVVQEEPKKDNDAA